MITAFAVYFVTANHIASGKTNARTLVTLIVFVLLVQSGVAIHQRFNGTASALSSIGLGETEVPTQWGEQEISRAGGLMGHPNSLAALILMLGPVGALATLFDGNGKRKLLYLLTTGTAIFALLLTFSRSAWVGVILGTVLSAPCLFKLIRRAPTAFRRRALLPGALIALIATVGVGIFMPSLTERMTRSDAGSAHSRIDMMLDAVAMINDHYLLGVGLNNYSIVVPRYDVTGIHREWQTTDVHNIFLLFTAETGAPSCGLFLFLVYRTIRGATRCLATCHLGAEAIMIAGTRLGLFCFLVQSTMDPAYRFYPGLQRTFWMCLGIMAGYNELRQARVQNVCKRAP
jgi:O-antigen ligase